MSKSAFIMRRFDSIGDFVEASVKGRDQACASSRTGGVAKWTGSATYEECVDHALHGTWRPEYVGRFGTMFDQLEPHLRKYVEVGYELGVDHGGCEVNMDAYLTGEPANMFEFLPTEHVVTKRAVCLLIGHSINSDVSSEELFLKGQAIIALVRSLNLLGFELEIWSEQTVDGRGYGGKTGTLYSVLTRLLGAGDIMDESAVEYAVGNPSWLRRLIFGLEEGESDSVRTTYGFGQGWGGYGVPKGNHHGELVGADIQVELGRDWFYRHDPEGPMKWVIEQLKEVGVLDQDVEIDFDD
jgi:hypothetical protein